MKIVAGYIHVLYIYRRIQGIQYSETFGMMVSVYPAVSRVE